MGVGAAGERSCVGAAGGRLVRMNALVAVTMVRLAMAVAIVLALHRLAVGLGRVGTWLDAGTVVPVDMLGVVTAVMVLRVGLVSPPVLCWLDMVGSNDRSMPLSRGGAPGLKQLWVASVNSRDVSAKPSGRKDWRLSSISFLGRSSSSPKMAHVEPNLSLSNFSVKSRSKPGSVISNFSNRHHSRAVVSTY